MTSARPQFLQEKISLYVFFLSFKKTSDRRFSVMYSASFLDQAPSRGVGRA